MKTESDLKDYLRWCLNAESDDGSSGNLAEMLRVRDCLDRITELEEAMQEFVERCDNGQVRSTYTYGLFKDLLS
jgi:hypothetical protein